MELQYIIKAHRKNMVVR